MVWEPPTVVTLHRYFIWCNRMRTHFDEILDAGTLSEEADWYDKEAIESFMYMSYWYAGLYVVIEGWKELGLTDSTIDGLLASPNVDLLRRYRNGAFHFQKTYFDERFTDFMKTEMQTVEWIRDLNRAFGGYFLNWFRTHNRDGSEKA